MCGRIQCKQRVTGHVARVPRFNTRVSWDGSSEWVRTGGHWLDGHSPTAQGNVVTAKAESESRSHMKCVSKNAENWCGTLKGTAGTIPKGSGNSN